MEFGGGIILTLCEFYFIPWIIASTQNVLHYIYKAVLCAVYR